MLFYFLVLIAMFDLETFGKFFEETNHKLNEDAIENNIYYQKVIENLTASTKEEGETIFDLDNFKNYVQFENSRLRF